MSAVMRVAALILSLLALAAGCVLALAGCSRMPYARSDSGFSALDKKVLYDFRTQPGRGAQLDEATTRRVLSAVFPSYLADARQCRNADGASRPGNIVPAIRGSAEGSFTAAGLRQVVYLIDVGECNQRTSSRRLAVFTAGALSASVEAPVASEILRTYDLNNDRRNELLLYDSGAGHDEVIATATVVEFDKDKLRTFEDFGQIYDSTCATALPAKSLRASVVYFLPPPPGQKPRFTVELYRAPCPAKDRQPQWSLVVADLK